MTPSATAPGTLLYPSKMWLNTPTYVSGDGECVRRHASARRTTRRYAEPVGPWYSIYATSSNTTMIAGTTTYIP